MNPQDLLALTDSLVARYGATGTHLLALAQRQALVEAWVMVYGCLFCLAAGLISALFASKRDWGDTAATFAAIVFLFAATFLGLGVVLFALPRILNPEWAGIRELIGR